MPIDHVGSDGTAQPIADVERVAADGSLQPAVAVERVMADGTLQEVWPGDSNPDSVGFGVGGFGVSGYGSGGYDDGGTESLENQLEAEFHIATNDHRSSQGLTPYAYRDDVAAVARSHSQNMYGFSVCSTLMLQSSRAGGVSVFTSGYRSSNPKR